jgi:3-dehydroquinate synthase
MHDLPVVCPSYNVDALWEAMGRDKKKQGKALRWILPRRIGEVDIIENVPREIVVNVLRDIGAM